MLACKFLFSYNPFPFCELGSNVPITTNISHLSLLSFYLGLTNYTPSPGHAYGFLAPQDTWELFRALICQDISLLSLSSQKHLVCPLFALTVIPFQITEPNTIVLNYFLPNALK